MDNRYPNFSIPEPTPIARRPPRPSSSLRPVSRPIPIFDPNRTIGQYSKRDLISIARNAGSDVISYIDTFYEGYLMGIAGTDEEERNRVLRDPVTYQPIKQFIYDYLYDLYLKGELQQ